MPLFDDDANDYFQQFYLLFNRKKISLVMRTSKHFIMYKVS